MTPPRPPVDNVTMVAPIPIIAPLAKPASYNQGMTDTGTIIDKKNIMLNDHPAIG